MTLVNDLNQEVSNKNTYYLLTISGLKPGQAHPIQLRWQEEDGSRGIWSASKVLSPPGEPTIPVPSYPNVSTNPGIINISWDGKDSYGNTLVNFDRVEVSVTDSNNTFASVDNIAGSFKAKGFLSIPVKGGVYDVQLRTVSASGSFSSLTEPAQEITVEGGIKIDPPTLPSGLTLEQVPFGVAINWAGTYTNNATFSGFRSINIYASSTDLGSSTTTMSASKQVGTMTVDVVVNRISVGLDAIRKALSLSSNSATYTTPAYYYYIASNANGEFYKVNGTPTYTRIGTTSIAPAQANKIDLTNGLISIENLVAGNGKFTTYLRTGTPDGARIELNGGDSINVNDQTSPILPGLAVYSSGDTPIFRADLSGNVSFGGYTPSDIGSISTTANGKNKIFRQGTAPTAVAVGDIWVNTSDTNKIYIAASIGSNEIKSGEWELSRDTDLTSVVNKTSSFNSSGQIFRAVDITTDGTDAGSIRSVKQTYGDPTNTGWFLGFDGSTPKIDIGSNDNYLRWDGTKLEIKGQVKTYNSSGYIALGETAGQITFNSSGYNSPGYIKHSGSSGIGAIEIGSGTADGTGNPATIELWSYAGGSRAWITADSFINMEAYLFRVMSTSMIVDAFSWSYDANKTYTNKLVTVAPGGTLSKSGIGLWVSGSYGTNAPGNDIGQDGDLLFSS